MKMPLSLYPSPSTGVGVIDPSLCPRLGMGVILKTQPERLTGEI